MNTKYDISKLTTISGTFIWIGMVCAISFLESWLKFQAPGITLELGVGIGRLVFGMMNKVELILATVILFASWRSLQSFKKESGVLFLVAVLIVLAIQTLVLLPIMDHRADLRLQGVSLPASFLHFYYVGCELLKVIGLTMFGLKNIH
ncbi:hypothetical protein KUV50_02545 [Membranicola marinus]|uniref:DUF4149 domain-containing protein n=1 Tax=Membranihabitans marinus TaxID=1227546 RepID=A0A953L5V9_9BACT|nr:hypothetical protein [Membranihabitans marinus]MBY5956997.1 hypothetical protein [Membranihabitans marinus]